MSRHFKVWLDSGANAHSCRTVTTSLDELGYTDAEWDALSDDDKEGVMRDIAFDPSDWGWREVPEGERADG